MEVMAGERFTIELTVYWDTSDLRARDVAVTAWAEKAPVQLNNLRDSHESKVFPNYRILSNTEITDLQGNVVDT